MAATLNPDDFDSFVDLERFAFAQTRATAYHLKTVFDWTCQHMYIPLRTAERGFQALVAAGMLEAVHRSNRKPAWYLPKSVMSEIALKSINDNCLKVYTAKRNSLPPKGTVCRQKELSTAKRKRKQELTDEATDTSESVKQLELAARVSTAISETVTSSPADTQLADARRDSEPENEVKEASPTLTLEGTEMTLVERQKLMNKLDPETRDKVRQFGKEYTPKVEKKVWRDSWGNPVPRTYTRKKKASAEHVPGTDPGEADFYDYPE